MNSSPLIDCNALEPEPIAPFPDIPAEMPRVALESHVPATTDVVPAEPSKDACANAACLAAIANTNFGPCEQAILKIAGVDPLLKAPQPQQQIYSICNTYNVVPHEVEEVEEAEVSDDDNNKETGQHDLHDNMPHLNETNSSSDDESYNDEQEESGVELDEDFVDEDKVLQDAPVRTHSGRTSKTSNRYGHYTFCQHWIQRRYLS